MTEAAPVFVTRTLSNRKPTRFSWQPDAATREELARALDLPAINALSLKGEIRPEGRNDFRLVADLRADVVQSCVVTLKPVPAAIEEAVLRVYQAEWAAPEAEEYQIDEDDIAEPLPAEISILEVTREALALALPEYPRAEDAELGEAVFTEAGKAPLRDADLKPFAALAQLLGKSGQDTEGK